MSLIFTLPAFDGHREHIVTVRAVDVVKLSLRTSDPAIAKARAGHVLTQMEQQLAAIRKGPKALTQKQIVALAGKLYSAFAEALEDNPGTVERWQHVEETNAKAMAGQFGTAALVIGTQKDKVTIALEQRFGPLLDAIVAKHAVVPDTSSRVALLHEAARQMNAAAGKLKRNAGGDFRPDKHAETIPAWSDPSLPSKQSGRSLMGTFEEWKAIVVPSKKISGVTVSGYRSAFQRFKSHLGHDHISKITEEDIISFAESRLKSGVSPVTINDGDICALRSVLGWAKKSKRIPDNPAATFKLPVGKKISYRERGFTDDEALAVLRAALAYEPPPSEKPHTTAAKRWVPWLCAFSGARVGEVLQLRKQDIVRHKDGYWQMVITPAAGSVKTGQFRSVPLHPQLVELGFIEFVEKAKDDQLFLSGKSRGGIKRGGVANRLQAFVREIVSDPNVQPNHGWRHRFITQARKYGIDQESRRMITGHSGKSVDETHYGDPAGLYERICKLPAYPVD